jgi:hypothetical protein
MISCWLSNCEDNFSTNRRQWIPRLHFWFALYNTLVQDVCKSGRVI